MNSVKAFLKKKKKILTSVAFIITPHIILCVHNEMAHAYEFQ